MIRTVMESSALGSLVAAIEGKHSPCWCQIKDFAWEFGDGDCETSSSRVETPNGNQLERPLDMFGIILSGSEAITTTE